MTSTLGVVALTRLFPERKAGEEAMTRIAIRRPTARLNPANSRVYAACLDKTIKVFGLKSGSMLKELSGNHQQAYIQGFDFLSVKSP